MRLAAPRRATLDALFSMLAHIHVSQRDIATKASQQGNVPISPADVSKLKIGQSVGQAKWEALLLALDAMRSRLIDRRDEYDRLLATLREGAAASVATSPTRESRSLLLCDLDEVAPERLAEQLVQDARLPSHALFALNLAAIVYTRTSNDYAEAHARFECDAIRHFLAIREVETSSRICGLVGLAVGLGQSEIRILEKLLKDAGRVVHYLAIDISPVVAVAHHNTIAARFREAIARQRLIFLVATANVLTLASTMATIQSRAPRGFLTGPMPILATYLGNKIGNGLPDTEVVVLTQIKAAFLNASPLALLLGFSTGNHESEEYGRTFFEFLIHGPRYLYHDLGLLESVDGAVDEFRIDDRTEDGVDVKAIEKDTLYGARHKEIWRTYTTKAVAAGAATAGDVTLIGWERIYYYRLAHDIRLKSTGQTRRRDSLLHLFTIRRYEQDSLVRYLNAHGFRLIRGADSPIRAPAKTARVGYTWALFDAVQ